MLEGLRAANKTTVYDLSLLASLPNSVLPLLPSHNLPAPRPRPLFNIGIHDISYLSSEQDPWIACSTDTVLTMKPDIYDVLVTLPAPHTKDAVEKIYPKLSVLAPSKPGSPPIQAELKATQRDARRHARLRGGLHHLAHDENSQVAETTVDNSTEDDSASTYSSSPVVEPLSWAQLAYTSFIWWASAGEKREGLSEEEEEQQIEQDTRLLANAECLSHPHQQHSEASDQQPPEVALVAYFRRLTAQIFVILADVIARHDDDGQDHDQEPHGLSANDSYQDDPDEDEDENNPTTQANDDGDRSPLLNQSSDTDPSKPPETKDTITITTEDMTEMGLDIWSAADRVFVEELVRLWWGRQARVDCARIRCCGVTIL